MVGEDFDKAAVDTAKLQKNSAALAAELGQSPEKIDTQKALGIIAAGIEPNMVFQDGNTLLILAAFALNEDVVEALLQNGANPNIANKRQEAPLHYAAKALLPTATKALLAHGADIYAKDEFGDGVMACAQKGKRANVTAREQNILWERVKEIVFEAEKSRIKSDLDAAMLRKEIRDFTTGGCATRAEVKPMKRLQIKIPGAET